MSELKSKAIDWFLKQGVAVVILAGFGLYGFERFGVPIRDAHAHYLEDMASQQSQNTKMQAQSVKMQAENAVTQGNIVDLLKEIRAEQLRRDRG